MQMLTLTDFSDLLQHPFPVLAGGARLVMTLTGATAVSGGIPGGRKPFSLTFRGTGPASAAQAMDQVEHPVHGVIAISSRRSPPMPAGSLTKRCLAERA